MRTVGINRVVIGVTNLGDAIEHYGKLLNTEFQVVPSSFTGPMGSRIAVSWEVAIALVEQLPGEAGRAMGILPKKLGFMGVVFNVGDLKEAGRIAEASGVRVTRSFCLDENQREIAFAGAVTRFDEIVLDFETSGIPMVLANIDIKSQYLSLSKVGMRTSGINRIVIGVTDLEDAIEHYGKLLSIQFQVVPFSFTEPMGSRVAISWEAGIELVAQLPGEAGHAIGILPKTLGFMGVVFNVDDLKEAGRIAETSGVRVTREFCLNKTQMEIAFAGAVTRFDEIVLDFETSGIPMVLANIELSGSQSADEPS